MYSILERIKGLFNNLKKWKTSDIKEMAGSEHVKNVKIGEMATQLQDAAKIWKSPTGKMSDSGPPARPMKFPYTFSAKIAQFPYKYYIQNQWIWRYYFIALAVSAPVFYKISRLSNSPGNKAKWAEIARKEAEEHH